MNGSRVVTTLKAMPVEFGPLPLLLTTAFTLGCTAPPSSLGEPGEDGSSDGGTAATDGSTDTSVSISGQGSGGQTTGGSESGVDDTSAGGTTMGDDDESGSGSSTTGEPGDTAGVLFINFDGLTFTDGPNDATIDQAAIAGSFGGMALAPYGEGPKRDEVMANLVGIWAPFDIAITQTRPKAGDYAMIVVSPTNPFGGGVLGIASQDCGDTNPRSVGVTFASIGDALSAELTAIVISHEAGRGYGLENVQGMDIMSALAKSGVGFADQCLPFAGESQCVGHDAYCDPGQQNSFAEISAKYPAP